VPKIGWQKSYFTQFVPRRSITSSKLCFIIIVFFSPSFVAESIMEAFKYDGGYCLCFT